MSVQLRVGGLYLNRTGALVRIVAYRPGENYPFTDNYREAYMPNGTYSLDNPHHEQDLIEEVHQQSNLTVKDPIVQTGPLPVSDRIRLIMAKVDILKLKAEDGGYIWSYVSKDVQAELDEALKEIDKLLKPEGTA